MCICARDCVCVGLCLRGLCACWHVRVCVLCVGLCVVCVFLCVCLLCVGFVLACVPVCFCFLFFLCVCDCACGCVCLCVCFYEWLFVCVFGVCLCPWVLVGVCAW